MSLWSLPGRRAVRIKLAIEKFQNGKPPGINNITEVLKGIGSIMTKGIRILCNFCVIAEYMPPHGAKAK